MSDRERFTISIEPALSAKLTRLAKRSGASNRSKFLCDLIRARLVEEEWEGNQEALGTITMLYDHHQRTLLNALADVQHDHHSQVLCTTHIHLTHDLCAEVVMVRGKAQEIRGLADRMQRLKGMLHLALSMSSTGNSLT
jgi:CopG family nickel-responsive transcriptional regulator